MDFSSFLLIHHKETNNTTQEIKVHSLTFDWKRVQNMPNDIPNVLQQNRERDERSGVIPGVEFTFGSCLTEANITNFNTLSILM